MPSAIRSAYAERLAAREAEQARLARRDDAIARSRLAVGVVIALVASLALRGTIGGWWLVAPIAGFVALVVRHRMTRAARALVARSIDFHQRALARIDEQWAGNGVTGDRFHDPHHPYAEDLDLFGRGSLYELLCTCRTRAGEDRLAAWLLSPADAVEVRDRQAAAAELGPALDLREDLARLGDVARSEVDVARIVGWATAPATLGPPPPRALVALLGVAGVIAFAAWLAGAGRTPLVGTLLLGLPVQALARARSLRVTRAVDEPAHALGLATALLGRAAAEPFASPRLAALREQVAGATTSPVAAVRRLRRLVDLLDAQRNPLFIPIAIVTLWPVQIAFAIEAWRRRHGADVARWLEMLADLEALVAVGTYTAEHPDDALPVLVDRGPLLEGEGLGHPLIPATRCVRNDIRLGEACALLIVSGSNMSGKSTWLRTVGVNVVLAQMGAAVRARSLRLSPLAVGASIRTLDSLADGTSRFQAEIIRLRQLVDLASSRSLLFLLDEILHGTNSHDRRIGAEAIVRGLRARNTIGLITTHDLALATIAQDETLHARNVHFADHLDGKEMRFDYRMHDGIVTHSNALALMRAIGLEV
jgi:hypothetical protein